MGDLLARQAAAKGYRADRRHASPNILGQSVKGRVISVVTMTIFWGNPATTLARNKAAFSGVAGAAVKVKCHLMFGVVALAVDQILQVTQLRPLPA